MEEVDKTFGTLLREANNDEGISQFLLGERYLSGKGCKKDETKAFEMFSESAKKGYPAAQYKLEKIVTGKAKYSTQQSDRKKKTFRFKNKITERLEKGTMLKKGIGCIKDKTVANEMFHASADQGYPEALNQLASWRMKGKGCVRDPKKAAEWYYKSALQGNAEGLYFLGKLMKKGKGCEKDTKKAFDLISKSASQDYAPALFTLGSFYEKGKLCEKDTKKVFELYSKASNQNHSKAQFRLALCYKNGIGCEVDHEKYLEWNQKTTYEPIKIDDFVEIKDDHTSESNGVTVEKLVAEIQQMADSEVLINEILAGSAKLFMSRGKESVAKGDLTAAKAYYEVAKHAGVDSLTEKEKEKLQLAIARINTINRVEKEKKEKQKEDKDGNRRKMISEMQELQKEKEKLQKEKAVLEGRMKEVEKKEKELKDWCDQFEERSKRWAESGAISRELFVSTLYSL